MAVPSAPTPLQRLAVLGRDLAAQPTDVERGLEEVVDRGQALARRLAEVAVDAVEHLLGRRQVAGRLEHEDPVGRGPEHVQLAVGADVVDAGVGAGVGEEDEALVEAQGEAVGHGDHCPRRGDASFSPPPARASAAMRCDAGTACSAPCSSSSTATIPYVPCTRSIHG